MTLVRGEWHTQGARPILKAKEDVEQGDFAACAIQAADVAGSAITSGKLAAGSVTCAALAAGHVISEKASANLRRREYTVIVDKPSASSSDGWTTTYVLWQPGIAVNVLSLEHYTLGVYGNATCDNWAFYKNASSSFGQVALNTLSTEVAAGTRTGVTLATCVAVAAGQDIVLKITGSTCSYPSRSALVFGYESTA